MSERRFEGRVAIVTGASRGIGRAVAERLAAEGARLVLGYRRQQDAAEAVALSCRAAGADVRLVRGDVAAPETAAALIAAALDDVGADGAGGRLDVLVNAAGAVSEGLLATLGDDELATMLGANVEGLVRLCRAALRPMLRRRGGAIVNLSSALATRPGRGNAVYAGTKGFVESFTRALAVEVGRKNVRVNAVAPGVIDTDMTRAVQALAGDTLKERVALRRLGRPEEVAAAVAWLASDDAAYVNGAVLGVDGGFLGG